VDVAHRESRKTKSVKPYPTQLVFGKPLLGGVVERYGQTYITRYAGKNLTEKVVHFFGKERSTSSYDEL